MEQLIQLFPHEAEKYIFSFNQPMTEAANKTTGYKKDTKNEWISRHMHGD